MKKTSNSATSSKQVLADSTEELSAIHKKLKAMVNMAEYDLKTFLQLQRTVDPITADQMTVVYWDSVENMLPDYELTLSTGKVETKFCQAYPPLHEAIRFKGHERETLVRIEIKNPTTETVYNCIAPALLKAGIRLFLIFNDNTFLVLPKDEKNAQAVIESYFNHIDALSTFEN